jgi:hypothetical protein
MENYCTAGQATADNMAGTCALHAKAANTHTHTHTQYAILIVFTLQQRLHGSALLLSYTYTACTVVFYYVTKRLRTCFLESKHKTY